MAGFSWVLDNQLAGMARPGRQRPLETDLQFLEDQGIELLFSLTVTPTDSQAAHAHGIEVIHLPVADFTAPTLDQLTTFVRRAHVSIGAGHAVGVHCGAGKGRTGTFLAAYFVGHGMTAEQAIRHVRALRPGSVETEEQEQVLVRFAETFVLAPKERPQP